MDGRSLGLTALALWVMTTAAPGLLRADVAPPPIELRGMTFVHVDEASRRIVVFAERAILAEDTDRARLEEVTVEIFDEDVALQLRGDRAVVTLSGESFRLDGNVRGRASGRRFRTTWLAYDGEAGRFWTDAPVQLDDDRTRVLGGGLEYAVAERRLQLTGGTRVESLP